MLACSGISNRLSEAEEYELQVRKSARLAAEKIRLKSLTSEELVEQFDCYDEYSELLKEELLLRTKSI